MAGEVLSQSEIDALMAKNAAEEDSGLSPEVGALLAQGRDNREQGKSAFPPRVAEKAVSTSSGTSDASSGRSSDASVGSTVPRATGAAESNPADGGQNAESAQSSRGAEHINPAEPLGTTQFSGSATQGAINVGTRDLDALVKPLQASIDALAKRMDTAEIAVERIGVVEQAMSEKGKSSAGSSEQVVTRILYLEKEIDKINNTIQTTSRDLQIAMRRVQNMSSQMQEIMRGLNNTLGYDIRENFECQNCGSTGYVLGLVQCGDCGEENWWGWWPAEEADDQGASWNMPEEY